MAAVVDFALARSAVNYSLTALLEFLLIALVVLHWASQISGVDGDQCANARTDTHTHADFRLITVTMAMRVGSVASNPSASLSRIVNVEDV